jgi:transposase
MALLDQGLSLNAVAHRLGCAPSSVMRWRDARARHGAVGLRVRKASGRPSRLTDAQRKRLIQLLLMGAPAQGHRTDVWTTTRIADLIAQKFGVHYHPDHIGRLLRQLGWSHQKPERRAIERDEAAIERWKRTTWPRVKKTPYG